MGRYDWPRTPRSHDNPTARAAHLAALRPGVDPTTIVPAVVRKTRGRTRRAAPHNAPAGNQNLWFPIGPSVMTKGQAGGQPNVAGRIRDVQIEPHKGRRIYAASAGGGVWYSKDGGDSWRPLDEWQVSADHGRPGAISAALSCGALYVIWGGPDADESTDEVWVGTGEVSLTTAGQQGAGGGEPGGAQLGGKSAGIGFLHRDPAVAGGGWSVDAGPGSAGDPFPLRGQAFYRIANDPHDVQQLVAATTRGLYFKVAGGAWTRITTFAAGVNLQPLDVVLTRSPDNQTLRIWVATPSALRVAEVGGGAPITAALTFLPVVLTDVVVLPAPPAPAPPAPPPGPWPVLGTCLQLAAAGTRVYVLGRSTIPAGSDRTNPPAAVWAIDADAALTTGAPPGTPLTVAPLTGTPPDLFMSSTDQSSYDMCIAAHPSVAGRIYLGGATVGTSTGWNGAIYRCETTATALSHTLIGEGTHADIHVLRVVPLDPPATANAVWAGTDGGLFRSLAEGDPDSFHPVNNGLAVLQPGFVANHRTNPGIVAAGFQDNGTAVRIGDGVWQQTFPGDGGGVVYDPVAANNRYLRQYTQATWESSDGGAIRPIERRQARKVGTVRTSESIEGESSRFYSGTDAVLTRGTSGTDTHLVLGSDRVWYSRDWGRSWVTLPTATDPRAGDRPDLRQDVLDPIAGSPIPYVDKVGSTDSCSSSYTGSGVLGSAVVTTRLSVVSQAPSATVVVRVLALYGSGLVWLTGSRATSATGALSWGGAAGIARQAIRDPTAGAEESDLTNGNPLGFLPAKDVVSDVYVHDPAQGTLGSCYVTTTGFGYRSSTGAIPRDTLWHFDGIDKWRPAGLSTTHNGQWTVPADRVAAPALGVVVDPDNLDVVYVATSTGVVRGELAITGTNYLWTWTQFMNGLPEAVVQDLSLFTGSGLKLLRAATQARGVWEVDLANVAAPPLSYLRVFRTDTRRILPSPVSGDAVIGEPGNVAHWDDSPDIVIDTTGVVPALPPSEVELMAIPSAGDPFAGARVTLSTRTFKVHVLAHHRLADLSLAGDQVRIALLRHVLPAEGAVPLGGVWDALKAAAGAAGQPGPLPDGWSKAGADLWITRPASDLIDPRLPRALTFDVDLTDVPARTDIVLMAVVMNPSNPLTDGNLSAGGGAAAQTADQLVLNSPHVAAKSIHLS